MKYTKRIFSGILAVVLAVTMVLSNSITAYADMTVSEFDKEFFLDVVSEYSGEFPGMFRYKDHELYVDVQTLAAMAEFVSYDRGADGSITVKRGGWGQAVFRRDEVVEGDKFIWYVPFEKAMVELVITCLYLEDVEKLVVQPLDDNVLELPGLIDSLSKNKGFTMYYWQEADFLNLEQSKVIATTVDYCRNWDKIPGIITGMADYEKFDTAVKNILIPNVNNYYISDDIVKLVNDFTKIASSAVGDTVNVAYGAVGVLEKNVQR